MMLYFNGPFDRQALDGAILEIARAVAASPVDLGRVSFEELEDRDGLGAWRVVHEAPGVRVEETVASSEGGNPRDGYGYEMSWVVTGLGPRAGRSVRFTEGDWGNLPKHLYLDLRGLAPAEVRALRAALAARLGAGRDESGGPWIATANVRDRLAAGDVDEARALLDEAWPAARPGMPFFEELVGLRGRVYPATPEEWTLRAETEPGQLDVWESLAGLDGPDRRGRALRALALLQPWRTARLAAALDDPDLGALRSLAPTWLADPAWRDLAPGDAGPRSARLSGAPGPGWWSARGPSAPLETLKLYRDLISALDASALLPHYTPSAHWENGPPGAFPPAAPAAASQENLPAGGWRARWEARFSDPARRRLVALASLEVNLGDRLVRWWWVARTDLDLAAVAVSVVSPASGWMEDPTCTRFAVAGPEAGRVIGAVGEARAPWAPQGPSGAA